MRVKDGGGEGVGRGWGGGVWVMGGRGMASSLTLRAVPSLV